ncbi:hypothetical protein PQ692_09995 [Thermoanaerobacterium thermosaccharolyticum]|uniref:hypothetical protein n=1 Tax=Thermoanaerobacterium thermosaccharolyticum TaxID=1517 RepID=UPI003DA8D9D8
MDVKVEKKTTYKNHFIIHIWALTLVVLIWLTILILFAVNSIHKDVTAIQNSISKIPTDFSVTVESPMGNKDAIPITIEPYN